MRKCQWCGHTGKDVLVFVEIWPDHIGEAQHVCKKHLIPGEDPCPIKPYSVTVSGVYMKRFWVPKEELGEVLKKRDEWFKEHEEVFAKNRQENAQWDETFSSKNLPIFSQRPKDLMPDLTRFDM